MQWPTFACQIAHCPAWLTVGTSPCGVALGGSRGHARAEERAGGKAAFLAAKGPGCQAGLCQPVAPALDTSLELICLAVGSVCKLHRPFAAPLRPLAWPSKGSQAKADWQAVSSAAHGCHTIRSSQLKHRAPTNTHTYRGKSQRNDPEWRRGQHLNKTGRRGVIQTIACKDQNLIIYVYVKHDGRAQRWRVA